MPLYTFVRNLLNVLVQTANKMGLQIKKDVRYILAEQILLKGSWRLIFTACVHEAMLPERFVLQYANSVTEWIGTHWSLKSFYVTVFSNGQNLSQCQERVCVPVGT
jgi:hypothetical protein